jgi:hypothetical protein
MDEKKKTLFSGMLFLCIGGFFKIYSQSYQMGTASFMGPGYYPDLLSNILMAMGVILIIKALLWKS